MKYFDFLNEHKNYIFEQENIILGLRDLYQFKLTETSIRLFGFDLNEKQYNQIWHNVLKSKNLIHSEDMYAVVFHFYRKFVLSELLSGNIFIIDDNSVIKKIENYPEIKEKSDKNFSDLLSIFEKNEFDYFIDRYFYFNPDVKYNLKLEKKIAKKLNLKSEYFFLRFKKFTKLDDNCIFYPYYLLSISNFMLRQIGCKYIRETKKVSKYDNILRNTSLDYLNIKICIIIVILSTLFELFYPFIK